jgi:hypothetical protein
MISRILLSTINYDHPQNGMRHAFEGIFGKENVIDFDFMKSCGGLVPHRDGSGRFMQVNGPDPNETIFNLARQHRPDWIWLQIQDSGILQPETFMQIRRELPRCVISHWTGDVRQQVSAYLSSICRSTHLTLASSRGQIPMFRAAGAPRANYLQIGVDWQEDVQGTTWEPPFRVPGVVFIGNYHGNTFPGTVDRENAIRVLKQQGIDVGVVGSGWPTDLQPVGSCHVKQQSSIWKRAQICLSINHFNDIESYYSDRQLIAMASGTPVVCRYIPGLEREFENGVNCMWYQTGEQLLECVRHLLASQPLRVQIGRRGRAEVLRKHTWFNRVLDVLPEIETIQKELG